MNILILKTYKTTRNRNAGKLLIYSQDYTSKINLLVPNVKVCVNTLINSYLQHMNNKFRHIICEHTTRYNESILAY